MGSLEDLWRLQNHNNILKEINNSINDFSNLKQIEMLGKRLKDMEKKLKDLDRRIKENASILHKNNFILKEYDYKLGAIEKDLYEGQIIDLKQLSFLDREREDVRKEIEEKEMEILLGMEEIEELKKEFTQMEKDFNILRKEYSKLVKSYRVFIEELKDKAKNEKQKIEEISSKMDEKIFNKYINLTKTKGIAVVEVIESRCGGCNMLLPAITMDRLKNHREIIYCENCDRILYLK